MKIMELLEKKNNLTFDRVREFELLLNSPVINDNLKTVTIPPAIAYKYIHDFYGLLKQYLHLPEETFYFFLRVNDLFHPLEYDGFREIKVLDPETFNNYIELMEMKESIQ